MRCKSPLRQAQNASTVEGRSASCNFSPRIPQTGAPAHASARPAMTCRRFMASTWGLVGTLVALAVASAAAAVLAAPAIALPPDRAYELVSPPDKEDGEIGAGGFQSGFRASISGDRVAYTALGGFAGAGSNMVTGGYVAERGSESWATKTLQLPTVAGLSGEFGPMDLARDLSRAVVQTNADPATGHVLPMFTNYLYDPFSGTAELLTPLTTTGGTYTAPLLGQIMGATDFDPVYFEAPDAALTDDAEGLSGMTVYRYTGGELTLASILPDGTPTSGNLAWGNNSNSANPPWTDGSRTVSDDGDVLFFVSNGTTADVSPVGPLYRRDFRSQPPATTLINASENEDVVVPVGDALFAGASADGEIAFFLSKQQLVEEDTNNGNDLYRYESDKPVGERLELISVDSEPSDATGEVGFALGVGADGKTIYFTSSSQLVEGEPTAAGTKMYVWHDGELRFITNNTTSPPFRADNASLSDDGSTLAFIAADPNITPDPDGGVTQVYVYELAEDRLSCASCQPAHGGISEARIHRGSNVMPMTDDRRRYAVNGGTVFFDTATALVPQDTNGKQDAYIWTHEDGPQLLSSGRGASDSYFIDASIDGSDAFFVTRDRLVGWDTDSRLDVYDARLGGGLPEPPKAELPCNGDACQGTPSAPPSDEQTGTIDHAGPGNAAACVKARRKANRLGRKVARLQREASQRSLRVAALRREAGRRHGKRAARLSRKAKRANRAAAQVRRRATRVAKRAKAAARRAGSSCGAGGQS